MSTGFRESGALVVAVDGDDAEELRRHHLFQQELGLGAEWLTPRECRRLEPGLAPGIAGAILAPQDAHADPEAVMGALQAALEAAGGAVRSGAEVEAVEHRDGRVTGVRTTDGAVTRADQVVVAAGAWSPALDPAGEGPPVRPVKGQILELRVRGGQPEPVERIVRSPRCYIVARGDGRLVLGATVEEQGFDTTLTAGGVRALLEAAWELVPEVEELELVRARAGLRPGTPDNAPAIGRGRLEGLVWATGHHRNGVLLTPLTAGAVAALLADGDAPPEVGDFDPARFGRSRPRPAVTAEGARA